MVEIFLYICGAVAIVATAFATFYKGYRYWYPATASISYSITALKEGSDAISVTITSKSSVTIYIQSCSVRCTYSLIELIKRHIRQPFLRPGLYPNLRYNSCVYQFIKNDPIKLEPAEQITLTTEIYEHPLNALYGPMLISFATLTTGRTIKSKRMQSPPIWRLIGRRGKVNT